MACVQMRKLRSPVESDSPGTLTDPPRVSPASAYSHLNDQGCHRLPQGSLRPGLQGRPGVACDGPDLVQATGS